MDRHEMEAFRRWLETILSRSRQSPPKRDEIAVENSPDLIDRSQRMAESDVAIQRIDSAFNRTQDIELALDRIVDGTYGICLKCDSEINRQRLRALPWARHCIRCQEIEDLEKRETQDEGLYAFRRLRDAA